MHALPLHCCSCIWNVAYTHLCLHLNICRCVWLFVCMHVCVHLQVCSTSYYEAQPSAATFMAIFRICGMHMHIHISVLHVVAVAVAVTVTVFIVAVVLQANCLFKPTEKLYYFALKVKSVLAAAVTNGRPPNTHARWNMPCMYLCAYVNLWHYKCTYIFGCNHR